MSDQHIWRWSAVEIARAVRDWKVSVREVIEAHLERIEDVNGTVNALTVVFAEDALTAADAADAAGASSEELGALHGVPITVKENIDVLGSATTHGVVGLKDSLPSEDAPLVQHLKNAGAIVIGRSNMPDYGMRWHTDNDLHGPTLNPWNAACTPGGSSGGEAAALATGMSPLGIGNDMGGSTRQPAVNCGVCGLRPSLGRVSRVMSSIFDSPPLFYEQVACVNGPMARSVSDLRLALGVMSQRDPTDPPWVPAAQSPLTEPGAIRVGLVTDPSGVGTSPAVLKALATAASALRQSGYIVEDVDLPFLEASETVIQRFYETEIDAYIDDILPMMSGDAARILRSVMGDGKANAANYRTAIAERHRIAVAWGELMDRFPLILGPVSTLGTFEVGYDVRGKNEMQRLIKSFRLTEMCNLLGLPSVAIPVSVEDGLPQGVQIIGRRFDEDRCFDAAEAVERVAELSTPIDPVASG